MVSSSRSKPLPRIAMRRSFSCARVAVSVPRRGSVTASVDAVIGKTYITLHAAPSRLETLCYYFRRPRLDAPLTLVTFCY